MKKSIIIALIITSKFISAQNLTFDKLNEDSFQRLSEGNQDSITFIEKNDLLAFLNPNIQWLTQNKIKKKAKNSFVLLRLIPLQQSNDNFFITYIFYKVHGKKRIEYSLMGNIKIFYRYDCQLKYWTFEKKIPNFI